MPRTEEQIQQSKERRRTYMREYKRNQYKTNGHEISENNKKYYIAKTGKGITLEEINRFSVMATDFAKVTCLLRKIQLCHPDVLKDFLQEYIETLEV
jgi:hypothetical protein